MMLQPKWCEAYFVKKQEARLGENKKQNKAKQTKVGYNWVLSPDGR